MGTHTRTVRLGVQIPKVTSHTHASYIMDLIYTSIIQEDFSPQTSVCYDDIWLEARGMTPFS